MKIRFQAATAHSFHLSEELALQSVTSVPARSLEIDHRVGFVRPGYDADLVVWDSHPLSVGATPLQVYIDGRATLDPKKVKESQPKAAVDTRQQRPRQRKVIPSDIRAKLCEDLEMTARKVIITGIKESYLDHSTIAQSRSASGNLTMIIQDGSIVCFGTQCASTTSEDTVISLENGYVLPGLTAVSVGLGLMEISSEDGTSDGSVSTQTSSLNAENVIYAKYGVHLDGKSFKRARIGGVTKAISAPIAGGFSGGVSVGIKTREQKVLSLDDGIFQDEVALHFQIGQESKGAST